VKYVVKGEEESKEEVKADVNVPQAESEQKPRGKKRPYKERVVVTLETVIPELPKKGEKLSEPDDTIHKQETEKLTLQITQIKAKMHDMIKDERKKLGLTSQETAT